MTGINVGQKKPEEGFGGIGGILGAIVGAAAIIGSAGLAAPAVAAGEVGAAGAASAAGELGAGAAVGAAGAGAAGLDVGTAGGMSLADAAAVGGEAPSFTSVYGGMKVGQDLGSMTGSAVNPGTPGKPGGGVQVDTSAAQRRLGNAPTTDPMEQSQILKNSLQSLAQQPPPIQQAYGKSLTAAYIHSLNQDYDRQNGQGGQVA